MAENFSFFDPVEVAPGVWDREYFAQQFTDYFRRLVTTGVMKGESGELKVSTEGNSMITTISTGVAYVVGRSYENTSLLTHTHDTEVLGKNRIDRIVVRLDLRTESRFVKSFIKKGVASTSPVPPDLQRDQFIYEISLAQVKIIGGQTYINVNDVIDERGKIEICPWAGSKILPNFDNNALLEHVHDFTEHIPYAITTGDGSVYNVEIDQSITEYKEGLALAIKIHLTNNRYPKINVNGIGEAYIANPSSGLLIAGLLQKGNVYTLRYNGNAFVIQGETEYKTSYFFMNPWSGWIAEDSSKNAVRRVDDIVYGFGIMKKEGANSTPIIAQLPQGFRPTFDVPFNLYGGVNGTNQVFNGLITTQGYLMIDPKTPVTQINNNNEITFIFSFMLRS